MSTLGLNARVWVAWWPMTELEQSFAARTGDPRLRYATIKDGPTQIALIKGDFWHICADGNHAEGWVHESVLWPVGGEPMDQDVTRPVEEHSDQ